MTTSHVALNELHRGMSIGYQARAGYYAREGLAQVEQMAAMNIRWVALQINVMQDTFYSTRLYQDFEFTPKDYEVEAFIEKCHKHGIRVMLKPMVECHDSAWRGQIRFPDNDEQIQGVRVDYWSRWFKSLTDSLLHYGSLAERTGCEMLCVGCELDGTQHRSDDWRRTIARVREIYSGPLTYDPTHRALKAEIPCDWFDALDMLGLSFYFPAADKAKATVEEMVAFLQPRVQQMEALHQRFNKPIVFVETGTRSMVGGGAEHDYRLTRSYDGQEQANYTEAVLAAFWDKPWWRGQYVWKWDEQQDRPQYRVDPAGDTGFTVIGKPAADVLSRWYARTDRD